jgi:hypothetical protein
MTPFNKPYLTCKELPYIQEAVEVNGHISGLNNIIMENINTHIND